MNIEGLLNLIRREVMKALSGRATVKKGTVTSYNADNYSVKVLLQPEETETGWLPLAAEWVGNGWGMFAPPSIGDMVDVHFDEGDRQSGYVSKKFYNNEDRPLACPSQEFWLVHKSGSLLKFLNSGDVQVVSDRDLIATAGRDLIATATRDLSATVGRNLIADVTGDADLTVGGAITSAAASWEHTGPVTVIGLLTASGLTMTGAGGGVASITGNVSITGSLTNNSKDVGSGHKHSGVQTGGGQTGAPV